ncbi:MAG: CDP-glucose 4,6-dehydratase [Elusimicrobia bacterium]|nr:CDP-glucose 4,6-dehydratase [Elusimicrobiota bacterium]
MNAPFGGAWKGRRVLVTGHTGFKGSWLSFWLARLGAEVSGFALPPEGERHLYGALGLDAEVRSRLGDLRELAAVEAAFAEAKPEFVFHLAAQPLVLRSYAAPLDTFAVNVLGTANVLEAARRRGGVQGLVVVTTDKVYEDPAAQRPRAESDPLGGHDPYSSSKAAAELVSASYRLSFDLPLATARAGNVLGGGDWAADRILPDCARAFAAGRPAVVRNPGSVRPWQHVLEPLSGYLALGARLLQAPDGVPGAWNFGPSEDGVTVADVAGFAAEAWGDGAAWRAEEAAAPHEAAALRLDSAKAKIRLGWRPVWDARRAVSATVEWYKAAGRPGFDARATTEAQTEGYAEDAREAGAAWAVHVPAAR